MLVCLVDAFLKRLFILKYFKTSKKLQKWYRESPSAPRPASPVTLQSHCDGQNWEIDAHTDFKCLSPAPSPHLPSLCSPFFHEAVSSLRARAGPRFLCAPRAVAQTSSRWEHNDPLLQNKCGTEACTPWLLKLGPSGLQTEAPHHQRLPGGGEGTVQSTTILPTHSEPF